MLKTIARAVYSKGKVMFSPPVTVIDPSLKQFFTKRCAKRLSSLPRRKQSDVILFGKQLIFPDAYWFLHSLREIFVEKVYWFKSTDTPLILDCGANIGLSVIYFKQLFPAAKIIAFEPDEKIFYMLKENIEQFNFSDVELINKGVWKSETTLSFLAEGTLGGRVAEKSDYGNNVVSIQTTRLREYLDTRVDFLKIDIEGAEYDVLLDCADRLENVGLLFIEYHSRSAEPQKLDEILGILTKTGFRYYIREAAETIKYPYVDRPKLWFDVQLNIFCYRP